MFAGPIFAREWLITPRQLKHYLLRAGYVGVLIVLMYTAGHATFGFAQARNVGDIARFGRFPHRNTILGRETTPEEARFLEEDSFRG